MKPVIEGLVHTPEEAATTKHPLPIVVGGDHYSRLMCLHCGHIGQLRSVLQTALADRIAHARSHM